MRGRQWQRLRKAHGGKFRQRGAFVEPVGLVYGQQQRLAGAAQDIEDVAILRQQTLARVDHEHDTVGFCDGQLGLARGKKLWDKRADAAKRDVQREIARHVR